VGDDEITVREEQALRDIALQVDVRWLWPEGHRVLVTTRRDNEGERLVPQPLHDRRENVFHPVDGRAHRGIDDRAIRQLANPGRQGLLPGAVEGDVPNCASRRGQGRGKIVVAGGAGTTSR